MYPVIQNAKLSGCVHLSQVKHIAREEWTQHTVKEIMGPCDGSNTIDIKADAVEALSKMRTNGLSRIMVTRNSQLAGIVTLKDLLEFLSLKVDLEEGA
jgi:predicted transcriptional regulator